MQVDSGNNYIKELEILFNKYSNNFTSEQTKEEVATMNEYCKSE
ncbi:hypothetical protein [Tepidibacter mesophilus]|nr:hypothetical protein [Tepidibacter mesophilus]